MAETPEQLVQRQLEAYNARDVGRFAATYAEDVKVYRMPGREPTLSGRAALAEHYAKNRFQNPKLHADIVRRIVLGNKVIDHERVVGIEEDPVEVVAVYEVYDGLIRTVWFFAPE
jgi:uncharacterized protein (TIGR02246 family)